MLLRHTVRLLTLTIFLTAAVNALAFDVVITGSYGNCLYTPITRFMAWLDDAPGATIEAREAPVALTATPGGRFVGLSHRASGTWDVVSVRPDAPATPVATIPFTHLPEAMVADAAGNLFILGTRGSSEMVLASYTSTGETRASWTLGNGLHYTGMDLASDQCTLYLSRHGGGIVASVARFNVCTGAFGAELVSPEVAYFADVKVLNGGDVLVAAETSGGQSSLRRYSTTGTLLNTIPVPGPGGAISVIALAAGGRTAFVAYECANAEGSVREWDLATGALLHQYDFEESGAESMVAANGWTAAFGHVSLTDVPTLSELVLFSLAGLLSLLGVWRLCS